MKVRYIDLNYWRNARSIDLTIDKVRKHLEAALNVGVRMLESGAEIYRVEESVSRICTAFGATQVEVYAVNYLILVTVSGEGYSGVTESRRVKEHDRNLTKLAALNDLSRSICSGNVDFEEVADKLDEIDQMKGSNLVQQMLIYALISSSFTIFFGGSVLDAIVSGVIGILVAPIDRLLGVLQMNRFIRLGLCSFLCGIMAALSLKMGLPVSVSEIGIGNIMVFIPGVIFTYAIQEILANNTMSGFSKMIEAIVISMVIAAGFVVAASAQIFY